MKENKNSFTSDPHSDWIRDHHEDLFKHVGKFVVIHSERGIIDVGDDPVVLGNRNKPWDDIMIHYVGEGFYGPNNNTSDV